MQGTDLMLALVCMRLKCDLAPIANDFESRLHGLTEESRPPLCDYTPMVLAKAKGAWRDGCLEPLETALGILWQRFEVTFKA